MLNFEDFHVKVFPHYSVDVTRDDGEYLGLICLPSITSRK